MSITATADGTSYNGIDTITVGGKTISLRESGGSSGGVVSGTFTGNDTVSKTINTGLDSVSGFVVYRTTPATNSSRALGVVIYDGTNTIDVGSNGTDSTMFAIGAIDAITATISGGDITITSTSGQGSFLSAITYKWTAW